MVDATRTPSVVRLLLALASTACGASHVSAVVESEEPFHLPGVPEAICLTRNAFDVDYAPHLGRSRNHTRPMEFVLAPADARIRVGAQSYPIDYENEAQMATLDSKGWDYYAYEYRWDADDENRAAPPDVLIRMAQLETLAWIYDPLLRVICDGNADCVRTGSRGYADEIDDVSWTIHTIACGQTFEYAGPLPE
jgi:hypothetical protein